ncbi:MAG: hypothetical protein V7L20_13430 [Nostoc sp.]
MIEPHCQMTAQTVEERDIVLLETQVFLIMAVLRLKKKVMV